MSRFHGALFLVAWVSYRILHKGYVLEMGQDSKQRSPRMRRKTILACVGVATAWLFVLMGISGVWFLQAKMNSVPEPVYQLMEALEARDLPAINAAMASGVDPNARMLGNALIFIPLRDGDSAAVRALVQNGADVNIVSKYGRTPLHQAALYGHVDIAEFLLKNGADVNARNPRGETPLFYAEDGLIVGPKRTENHKKLSELLRRYGGRK